MKTFFVVVVVVVLALLLYNRQRIYVHDFLATVYRNDVQQPDAQVYINYSNDVLLMENDFRGSHNTLVQDWNRMPGTPTHLTCLRWTACLTDADRATTIPLTWTGNATPATSDPSHRGDKGKYDPKVFITGHEVTYVDGSGTAVRIELR